MAVRACLTSADKEIDIAHKLAETVLECEELLNTTSDICGELDSLLALALGAQRYKLCRPRMTERNIIRIKGGRHPLQELTVPSFVGNDAYLVGGSGEEPSDSSSSDPLPQPTYPNGSVSSDMGPPSRPTGPSMVLVTGPNYSGKSVYLKQVALIVLMAHVGR